MRRFITLLCTLAAIAACSSDDDEPKTGNGVNDVHAACEIRAQWVRSGNNCSLCESSVVGAHCECESLKDFSGACLEQADARKAACPGADTGLDVCVFSCEAADCACIDKCYEAVPAACKTATNARDGCVTEACADHCK